MHQLFPLTGGFMNEKKDMRKNRRDFLRVVGATTASLYVPGLVLPHFPETRALDQKPTTRDNSAKHGSAAARAHSSNVAIIPFPRPFTGRQLARISFPLGGIGTGGIGLGGRGNLMDWEIFNRPDVGNSPRYAFPAIWAKVGNKSPVARVLERCLLPPFDLKPEHLTSKNAPGLPRLAEATFHGSFPIANIVFHDEQLPVNVSLEAFSSFQPVDADLSGLPAAILTHTVKNPSHQPAEVVIAWSLENPLGDDDHHDQQNEARSFSSMRGVFMHYPSLPADDPLHGSIVLAAIDDQPDRIGVRPYWHDIGWNMGAQRFWFDAFSKTGSLGEFADSHSAVGAVSIRQTIPPGEHRTFRFLVSWHFPNRTPQRCGWESPKGKEKDLLGNYYCTRFTDAWDAATFVLQNLQGIETGTRAFVHALQSSTLPSAVIEAASANLPTLVSNTSFCIADGSFHGFEGCGDGEGLGFGSCTHVWNYEVATQFLFPSLARSMRSTSFGYATNEEGHMDFRHKLPLGFEHWGAAAADGQMGQIVKLYLDWKLNGDDAWLRELWPVCKRALAYSWRPGGWDGNRDGVMEGAQHNTYDVEFYGPNPLCQIWYLAALKSSAEMAAAMNDAEFSAECEQLYELGKRWTDANLFDGEFYVQHVQGIPEDQIAKDLRVGMGAKDTLHPDFQAGRGCLIDQVLGQFIADLAGLGPLLDDTHLRRALASIYKYNYRHSMHDEPSVERAYSVNDESALVMCDYSNGERPEIPFPYYSENFTGSEYAAAILMMKYSMVNEGAQCIANIRARYDGEKANPYNEAEYGRHYARAMASWGAIPMLSGFLYNAPARELEIKPLMHSTDFACFWSTPTGWGNFQITSEKGHPVLHLMPLRGFLELRQIRLDAKTFPARTAKLILGKQPISCATEIRGMDAIFACKESIRVTPQLVLSLTA